MQNASRAGRPRASSRETLAEAACELFLEQGYDETSVADITRRAGVSRSSFFNYFSSKSDVLWSGLDARIEAASVALASLGRNADGPAVRAALEPVVRGFAPDPLVLALRNAAAMGVEEELLRDTGIRHARIASAVAGAARSAGVDEIRADILGAALAAAVLSALRVWAEQGAGQASLEAAFDQALRSIHDLPWG
ncbi:TetR family transcriptional regulator [Microbacterium esteraromaticum]|uniref:TetR family transcriptional regulator n=1 Tax=Microbacterium esteraromaticum TaxID=57043 RepID=A0A939IVE2_9MICO|nr:TetR/AcrR family transcriptional regulator [Microbacterium esteraromaticum]MBN7792728.1 TetR family transcriptional regulator [Microbacterium esteraromaticum]MBN8206004.1 TetR family transcriptional regulator [Microbacterium esteraromaticum]MBN8416159.1 TetR family transcriptional regulator [Microbacterium esteraromaticum]MBN8423503.1 TetR family transcriptional regulator [Microbacterium esteraromaticum]MCA1306162.1 TetR/AcrR family transcriptional regulator [Microbacterium esteraromaticum]